MQINIKTSGENQAVVTQLTRKLPGGTKENVIARIALGYSLSTGKRFTPQEFSSYDSQGKEYKDHILFDGQYRDFFIALVCQAYGITKNDDQIPKYIKLHIDHGLEKINYLFEHNPQYTFFDFLILLKIGISIFLKVYSLVQSILRLVIIFPLERISIVASMTQLAITTSI